MLVFFMAEDKNRAALPTEGNHKVLMGGVSSADGITPLPFEIDPLTGRALVDTGASVGGGTEYTAADAVSNPVTGTAIVFDDGGVHQNVTDTNGLPISQGGAFDVSVNNQSGLTDLELRAAPVSVAQGSTWDVNSYPVIYDGATPHPIPGDFTNGMDVDVTRLPNDTYSAVAVDATTLGNNTIVAITNTARLYYVSLSADGANSADVTAIVKIGASEKFKVSLKAGSIFARNIGAGRRYLTGTAGDDIIVELSAAQTVYVSVEYEDI